MTDRNTGGSGGQQQIQIRIDESKMTTAYANTIRTSTTPDEVVLDFGLNMPAQGQDGKPMMVFAVGSRVVMSWVSAKRLLGSLQGAIGQYEQQFGEIKLQRGNGGQA
ncbi:MAG: DUF3467 domain-containing protein [Phycisphaerales bacterium]